MHLRILEQGHGLLEDLYDIRRNRSSLWLIFPTCAHHVPDFIGKSEANRIGRPFGSGSTQHADNSNFCSVSVKRYVPCEP